jgi:excisionase family DNA binding protein
MVKKEVGDLITQAEAARLRGVSRPAIHKLVAKGKLRTVEIGGTVFVYRADVLSYERGAPGRPPKGNKKTR